MDSTSLVGTWVVLRGLAFLGDALAHGVLPGIAVAFILGALSSRTTGIYFLMLTFVYAVIGFSFFSSVVELSGSSGLTPLAFRVSMSR